MFTEYKKFFNDWNFDSYINSLQEDNLLSEELQKKVDELTSARENGYDLLYIKLLSDLNINYDDVNIIPFHTISKFAYRTNWHGNLYAQIDSILCKDLGVKDTENYEIYETYDGIKFVVHRRGGTAMTPGSVRLEPPRL